MQIRLVKKKTIEQFILRHPDSKRGFDDWFAKLKRSDWTMPVHIIENFNTADILGNGSLRVVFNIAGSKYRMICKYWFGVKCARLYIKWIGTHAEYDRLCSERLQYTINRF